MKKLLLVISIILISISSYSQEIKAPELIGVEKNNSKYIIVDSREDIKLDNPTKTPVYFKDSKGRVYSNIYDYQLNKETLVGVYGTNIKRYRENAKSDKTSSQIFQGVRMRNNCRVGNETNVIIIK